MKNIKCSEGDLAKNVADIIEKSIKDSKKEKIALGICGGRSVSSIFSELLKRKIDWKKVHFFYVDERISKKKEELNFTSAKNEFFNILIKEKKIKPENIHPFIFTENIEKDIFEYSIRMTRISYKFDIVLLSAGEDGHIASLFPNHRSIEDSAMGFIHVKNSPKAPSERVSATRSMIKESSTAILVFSKEKEEAYKKFSDKKLDFKECPAKIIQDIKDSYIITSFN